MPRCHILTERQRRTLRRTDSSWLADALARIAELPHTRVHELPPWWNWKVARNHTLAAGASLRTRRVSFQTDSHRSGLSLSNVSQ